MAADVVLLDDLRRDLAALQLDQNDAKVRAAQVERQEFARLWWRRGER